MSCRLYLSLTPEALVASMLEPEDFGTYYATGAQKRSQGQALFFDLKPGFESGYFDLSHVAARCVPHADGSPKHSVYISVYRVLEHVPLDRLASLWVVTRDGRVLQLRPGRPQRGAEARFRLYREICPLQPLIVSSLAPDDFSRFMTDVANPLHVPRICFVDLGLGDLAHDPQSTRLGDLPYSDVEHVRDCVIDVSRGKQTKTVDRMPPRDLPYRMIRSGFFVGDETGCLHYPFPSEAELDERHHDWWRSASE